MLNRFIIVNLNGKPTIVIKIESNYLMQDYGKAIEYSSLPTSTFNYVIAVHEEFHSYQANWKNISLNMKQQIELIENGRKNIKCRAQRLELINSLYIAILEPEKKKNIFKPLNGGIMSIKMAIQKNLKL